MSGYLVRARQALRTAESNLDSGDTIGASSRVYYAVFDAVRAVLSAFQVADLDRIRTHRGISHLFHVAVVQTGIVDEKIARVLPRALELRLSADYGSDPSLDSDVVRDVLIEARHFVAACGRLIETIGDAKPDSQGEGS